MSGTSRWAPRDWAALAWLMGSEIKAAIKDPMSVSLAKRLSCWMHGFFADKAHLYDFARYGYSAYLSDYQRHIKTDQLNTPFQYMVGDKLVAHFVLSGLGAPLPELYGFFDQNRFVPLRETYGARDTFVGLLQTQSLLALKPRIGSGGGGFAIAAWRAGQLHLNERPVLNDSIGLEGMYLVGEFVEQHEYASTLNPQTTNTLRVLTMWDSQLQRAFIASAVQRIGTAQSHPVDNWGKGGLSAGVDLESGGLGPATANPRGRKPIWQSHHPETGKQIEGIVVPGWHDIKTAVVKFATRLPRLEYVGWDIVVTRDGFKVLEGNNRSDVNLLQVHGPLLLDNRVKEFYRRRGVL